MNKKRIAIALTAALALAILPRTGAQEPQKGDFGDQVSVSEVLLDVLVTDRNGSVIIGLTPDDFVVEEDGKPVEVGSVTFYSNRRLLDEPGTLGEATLAIDKEPKSRYFILFFQDQQQVNASVPALGLLQRQLKAARESRQWVKKEKLLDDYVAVVSYDVKLKVQQDFTQDEQSVLRAIDNATTGKDPGANWPSRVPEAGVVSLRANLPSGTELSKKTETIYDALTVLADATETIVGRKNLLFFGTGFGETSGSRLFVRDGQTAFGETTGFGLYQSDRRYMPRTVQTLNDNNVAVYALDLMPNELEYDLSDALNELATGTGGKYFTNFVSFATPLKQVATENSGYYLLSYRSTHNAGENGYQKVDVRLKNSEFRVQAREGYLYGEPST